MRQFACVLLVWAGVSAFAQTTLPPDALPVYVPSSLANAASPRAAGLAPNTLATLYGKNLAWATRSLQQGDLGSGKVPNVLSGTGVRVSVGGLAAPILYVSPGQVNFLVPADLLPGPVDIRLSLDSRYGPAVRVDLRAAAPALFNADPEFIVAARSDGSIVSRSSPARPGEVVILYATGLGATRPPQITGELAKIPAILDRLRAFRVELGGVVLPPERVIYAGVAPGFAGLYQINLRLPETLEPNPTIRIGYENEELSPPEIRIAAER